MRKKLYRDIYLSILRSKPFIWNVILKQDKPARLFPVMWNTFSVSL